MIPLIKSKKCHSCYKIKPYSDYYNHDKMKGGKARQCKNCQKIYAAQYNLKYSDSEIDYNRICKHLHQPRNGISESNLVELWNIFTDLYLPRICDINKPLKSIITGEALNE